MKKTLVLFMLSTVAIFQIQAQQLCISYQTEIEDKNAQISVYVQSDSSVAVASYAMRLLFNQDKAAFDHIDYNPQFWEQTFASSNPPIQITKGKLNASMQITAVDMKPSSETNITKSTLLYSIRFKGKKEKLKKSDFSFLLLDQVLPEINYANYQGTSFPMLLCDFSFENERKEEMDIPFTIAPNPACGKVQITLEQTPEEYVFYSIYDLQGTPIQQQKLATQNDVFMLNLAALKEGVYFLSLQIDGALWTRKLMIRACSENPQNNTRMSKLHSKS